MQIAKTPATVAPAKNLHGNCSILKKLLESHKKRLKSLAKKSDTAKATRLPKSRKFLFRQKMSPTTTMITPTLIDRPKIGGLNPHEICQKPSNCGIDNKLPLYEVVAK